VACPTGVYYTYPEGLQRFANYVTTFASYDGSSLEPLDGRGRFVDMNHNNVRDQRETVEAAWHRRAEEGQRSGVLQPGQRLPLDRYVDAVEQVASKLVAQRLLSAAARDDYVERARASSIGLG
jgi:hypothetical protein